MDQLETAVNEIELNWEPVTETAVTPPSKDDINYWLSRIMGDPQRVSKVLATMGRCALMEFYPETSPRQRAGSDPLLVLPALEMGGEFSAAFKQLADLQMQWVSVGGLPYENYGTECHRALDAMMASLEPLTDSERAFFLRHMRAIVGQPRRFLPTRLSDHTLNSLWVVVGLVVFIAAVAALL